MIFIWVWFWLLIHIWSLWFSAATVFGSNRRQRQPERQQSQDSNQNPLKSFYTSMSLFKFHLWWRKMTTHKFRSSSSFVCAVKGFSSMCRVPTFIRYYAISLNAELCAVRLDVFSADSQWNPKVRCKKPNTQKNRKHLQKVRNKHLQGQKIRRAHCAELMSLCISQIGRISSSLYLFRKSTKCVTIDGMCSIIYLSNELTINCSR